jgi:catechol 2,3-dioxygenase-like lactoylglutathione lyase family enzyme
MLENKQAMATVAVKDVEAARRFYEGTLGLKHGDEAQEDVVTYQAGESQLLVYRSDYAGTNQATAVTWNVGNGVDDIVKQLRAKGLRFEHYELPDGVREGDVHVFGRLRVAWFKDPDGNIHSLVSA